MDLRKKFKVRRVDFIHPIKLHTGSQKISIYEGNFRLERDFYMEFSAGFLTIHVRGKNYLIPSTNIKTMEVEGD